MEITASGVSVYEVELDLKQWNGLLSSQVPGFSSALIQLMPSTVEHPLFFRPAGWLPCRPGPGHQLRHVVEHVLLELIHLAHPERPRYTGWTRDLGEGRCLIHYGAPDYLTGRLAAILAVDLVNRLQQQEKVDLDALVEQLRHPVESFTRLDDEPGPGPIPCRTGAGGGPPGSRGRRSAAGAPGPVRLAAGPHPTPCSSRWRSVCPWWASAGTRLSSASGASTPRHRRQGGAHQPRQVHLLLPAGRPGRLLPRRAEPDPPLAGPSTFPATSWSIPCGCTRTT